MNFSHAISSLIFVFVLTLRCPGYTAPSFTPSQRRGGSAGVLSRPRTSTPLCFLLPPLVVVGGVRVSPPVGPLPVPVGSVAGVLPAGFVAPSGPVGGCLHRHREAWFRRPFLDPWVGQVLQGGGYMISFLRVPPLSPVPLSLSAYTPGSEILFLTMFLLYYLYSYYIILIDIYYNFIFTFIPGGGCEVVDALGVSRSCTRSSGSPPSRWGLLRRSWLPFKGPSGCLRSFCRMPPFRSRFIQSLGGIFVLCLEGVCISPALSASASRLLPRSSPGSSLGSRSGSL